MYLVTNRTIKKGKGLSVFGKTLNPAGPLQLRLVKMTRKKGGWQAEIVNDKLTLAQVKKLKKTFKLDIDVNETWYGSLRVACELFERSRAEGKSILFYVHGFNNDVRDVLATAEKLEKSHGVIVVPFTWPANGGRAISGTVAYKSDKSDARASEGALNRFVEKIQYFHNILVQGTKKKLQKQAESKHKENPAAAQSLFSKLVSMECPSTINLLCHSMGNYLLKKTLVYSGSKTAGLVFDNICLVAADTNNARHATWVENLDVRNRIYIVINENDYALKAARMKPGDEQKARLGHYLKRLNSENAHYINVTDAKLVDSEHSYFVGNAMKNVPLRKMFSEMFNGGSVEGDLEYKADKNTYVL